jgi:hypothetical protein
VSLLRVHGDGGHYPQNGETPQSGHLGGGLDPVDEACGDQLEHYKHILGRGSLWSFFSRRIYLVDEVHGFFFHAQ